MKLDFKGLITKADLEKDINKLDSIIKENDYAIIVDNGAGKYVVFDMDYVKDKLELKSDLKETADQGKFTLVEAMIKALDNLPNKKSTAKNLAILVEPYYEKKASPVVVRTRAEENANDKGLINYFVINPGNSISLTEGITFDDYMYNKMKRAVELKMQKLFYGHREINFYNAASEIANLLSSPSYYGYADNKSTGFFMDMILSIGTYEVFDNEYLRVKDIK